VNSGGGVLVPEEWMTQIINLKEAFGVFGANAQRVKMTTDTFHWPRRVIGGNS
jgi:HK97 family phage major capsid protein